MVGRKIYRPVVLMLCVLCTVYFLTKPGGSTLSNHNVRQVNRQKYRHIMADKWIVVTTISYPTPDVRFLAKLPGWKVVVVGDTKTPLDWSLDNCVYLSIADQEQLGYSLVDHLPVKSYARKNVGYLFAIDHGAKVIYETDDDNRPLDMLKNFVLDESTYWLAYDGDTYFNPYRHFGQPTLWPRGYPLSAVGENISTNYRLGHFKSPSAQQGVVNGDPDMDAIFRLTRKLTVSVLNVTFDGRAPPALVPRGVFSPFNSQNTLFLYDGLWGMLIPTTTAFRVCDIWRGYWTQRLLWEMGGNLGFFPPNAFQKRNSHSYLLDAVDEKDLYFQTERLLKFLAIWRCKPENSFFGCVVQLSTEMAAEGFWKDGDALLTRSWVEDLKNLGYREPKRVYVETIPLGVEVISPKISNISFWPVLQEPPLKYPIKPLPTQRLVSFRQAIHYCKRLTFNTTVLSATTDLTFFSNSVLVIRLEPYDYDKIAFFTDLFQLNFPRIVFCGRERSTFEMLNPIHVTFIEVNTKDNCMSEVLTMGYNVDGYIFFSESMLPNIRNINLLPWDRLWIHPKQEHDKAISKPQNQCVKLSSIVYIPQRLRNDIISRSKQNMVHGNTLYNVLCEEAQNGAIHKITTYAVNFEETQAKDLELGSIIQLPESVPAMLKSKPGNRFYCSAYLPLILSIN